MSQSLWYIANVRFPSEKAYGPAIDNMCRALGETGMAVRLIVPRRIGVGAIAAPYTITRLPIIDLFALRLPGPLAFFLQTSTFMVALWVLALFGSRKTVIYTREPRAILLRYLGYKVFFECHQFSAGPRFLSLAKRATGIIAISRALQEKLIAAGVVTPRYLVAPSGVNLAVFDIPLSKDEARGKLNLPGESFLAVYTGNFTTMGEDKGIADILKALRTVPEARFVAVGGSDADIERYASLARDEGVSERVILRGHAPQTVLAEYQKAADVLLMPFPDTPHYREAMSPVKMFEYAASKRPIVATDLPTIREILDMESAHLISPENPDALAMALKELQTNLAQAEQTASVAYERVALPHSWTIRAKVVWNFLNTCIEGVC